jgi:thiol-disulfide isomerase/thioredoxin
MSQSILYIGASWCGPCKTIGPQAEALAKQFGLPIVKKDLDKDLTEDEKEAILKVPTIRILHENTHCIAEFTVNQVASLKKWLTDNVSLESGDF